MGIRKFVSVVVASLMLASLIPMGVASAVPIGEEFVCVQEIGPQNQIEFGSDIVVFKSKPGGDCDLGGEYYFNIWGYDMSSGQLFQVAENNETQNNPSVYGDIVVWMEVSEDDGEHDIFGKDLSTGDEFPICTREGEQCNPFIWENWVIYVDRSGDAGQDYVIHKYNLLTGEEAPINDATYQSYCPATNGVWAAYRSHVTTPSNHDEIWVSNLVTGETRVLESNTNSKTEVSMGNANTVVWSEVVDGRWRPVAYQMDTDTRSVLGTDTTNAWNPDVYNDVVVWSDSRTGYSSIYAHDLSEGTEVLLSRDDYNETRPRIWENTVVWQACGEDTWTSKDIHGVFLDATQYEVEGLSRYTTAVDASQRSFPGGAETIVIASGEQWPDALAASALAGAVNGPVLLSRNGTIPDATRAEIVRLGAKNAYIVGGTAALSQAVEDEFNLLVTGYVRRLGGEDRIETSELIAEEVVRLIELEGEYDGTAFLSTGHNYADSLAAAPLAAANGWPIFLANPIGPRQSTIDMMAQLGVDNVIILGGTAAIAGTTEGLVSAQGSVTTTRLAGDTRFSTAVAVAEYGVEYGGLDWEGLALTNGYNFPDALAGGPLQGISGSVVLLTKSWELPAATQAKLQAEKADVSSVKFLGGMYAISQAVRDQVGAIIE